MSDTAATPRWRVLVTPRWLSWHLFAVLAFAGMWWLGDWQLRRALGGNSLSWAYTFEWPLFAIFGAVFWVKTVKDVLHDAPPPQADEVMLPPGAAPATFTPADSGVNGGRAAGTGSDAAGAGAAPGQTPADIELAEYNAYLARLSSQVGSRGKRHGLS